MCNASEFSPFVSGIFKMNENEKLMHMEFAENIANGMFKSLLGKSSMMK